MSIDEIKYCDTHSKEKEKSGECCQISDKEDAEAATYENETKRRKNE
jgi:hypothetical protein